MKYLKKMNGTIQTEALGKGLIAGSLVSLFFMLVLYMGGLINGYGDALILAVGMAFGGALISVLISTRRTAALSARIRSLETISGPIDSDRIRMVSDDVALGSSWLIWKKGTVYKAWTKEMLKDAVLESENPSSLKAVLRLYPAGGREEKCVVTKSEALSEWVRILKIGTGGMM